MANKFINRKLPKTFRIKPINVCNSVNIDYQPLAKMDK